MTEFKYRTILPAARASFAVVLPKEYVKQLGLGKGSHVKCIKDGDSIIIRAAD